MIRRPPRSPLFPSTPLFRPPTPPLAIGEDFCREPYLGRSVVNISGMSFGAISEPAVRALSRGAALAGCWMDTGEGGFRDRESTRLNSSHRYISYSVFCLEKK